jgi:hypothetical protein
MLRGILAANAANAANAGKAERAVADFITALARHRQPEREAGALAP